jgi:dihydroorotase
MTAFDLLITDAQIVTPDRLFVGWLGVQDGRFAAVREGRPPSGAQFGQHLDASGLVALPGLVDCHAHLREPGLEHKEDFATGTAAAAAGGVTTLLVMPFCRPPVTTADGLARRRAIAQEKAVVDFGLQALVGPPNLAEVPALRRAGACSFEVFLADAPQGYSVTDDADLLRVFEAIALADGVVGVYCESEALKTELTRRLQAAGRDDAQAHAASRPPAGEAAGVARAALLAGHVGARLHLRQLSTRESVAILRDLKDAGDISAEVNPHHLFLTSDELDRQGPYARVVPPLRGQADVEALWQALRDGTIDLIATDHAPHARAEKDAGWQRIWDAPTGLPGLETWLSLMLDAAAAGRCTLSQIARWCAETPAQRFDLAGRKGSIKEDADADLVLADLQQQTTLSNERLYTRAGYTPFHGRALRGAVRAIYLRGQRIASDGVMAASAAGQFLEPALA